MSRLNLKAIGYGFATFVACTLLMTLVGITVGSGRLPPISHGRWALITIIGYLAPVIAGYVAARKSQSERILNGTVGGTVGALLIIAQALVVPGSQLWAIPLVLVWYAALASLGAIFGKHRANSVGP